MSSKKWLITFFGILIILILIAAVINFIIDPYFHYHALSFLSYDFKDRKYERYVNNGIVKNFDYDAMLVGTSLCENFKTTEFDELFNCNSIKVPLSGAQYKEVAEQTLAGINNNPNLMYVLYIIVYQDILNDKDAVEYEDTPTYLYDENSWNDYKYLLSGEAFRKSMQSIYNTLLHKETTTFDEYANWNKESTFSKESILDSYKRQKTKVPSTPLSSEEKSIVIENINQNIVENAKNNPNIKFYYILSPNNIVWWDSVSQEGKMQKYLEAEEILINSLLELDNVNIYSFFNNYDLICNLNYYTDTYHFSEEINSQILKWVKENKYLITKENVKDYLKKERQFYLNYDYDKIFSDKQTKT